MKESKKAKENNVPWTVQNTKPVFFGYTIDFHLGFEFGGALVDTTVKASSGKATQLLPAYEIVRLAPAIHGLFEFGRVSVEANATGRYLATFENTVLEQPNHSLRLIRVHGWHCYGLITVAYNIDPAGHFALSIGYKNGFLPPKFNRVNYVQSGIVVKF